MEKHGIMAMRSNGERVYFWSDENNGDQMLLAYHGCSLYDSREDALIKLEMLKMNFKGLSCWIPFAYIPY